eukprot:CAMPEP_0177671884 /NCGR_PEP_ID=MMETSP0447-20121125/24994_1 /TAXON_ID=0 /ORGANISM="Stygamoeba regulata, Strain BSH-02190019" /LENGTH=206 /DNA_ID=CAMNT_0019179411 /DNA_START=669 /DNA_END=1289 /DNA_ORIENTATION=+
MEAFSTDPSSSSAGISVTPTSSSTSQVIDISPGLQAPQTTPEEDWLRVELSSLPLISSRYMDFAVLASCGAVSCFIGTTRDSFHGKKVLRLEYEAYEPMALKEMRNLALLMREKWPQIGRVAIAHRVGIVPVGESSVVIAVSSVHRKDSLEAVQWCIDELKATVPVWKKEIYEDGSAWKANAECVGCRSSRGHGHGAHHATPPTSP